MSRIKSLCLGIALVASGVVAANAGTVDIDFVESAGGVSMSGSGDITLGSGLSLLFTTSNSGLHFVNPAAGGFGMGAVASIDAYEFAATTSFGTSVSTLLAPGTGDPFGIAFNSRDPVLLVPENYTTGTPLAFTLEAPGSSFASLGITPTDVTITAGANAINLNFSTAVVPLPAGVVLLMTALAGLGLTGARRKSAA
ncbi:VPLPA-CTERM sorting domain-containing protein [Jannaschia seohaensis]|uniref:Putative secreted protein n=1 Tax=Jannaschia seohaensis TaxID=475081 RepID=A0A2Y9A183_9RHOB|nr:VPLPA-CTERM sorting domain-containing protein [Jannaschia seohaensis]PWJ21932.1 putative secreted protein [Jannaschia seohaensis]SSA38210.1 VPLPA-CTERM protein sorting domain-containing protein [Jannaschia seohaensis]